MSGHLHPGCFASRDWTLVPTQLEAEWVRDLFWTLRRRDKPFAFVEDQTLPHPACGKFTILTVLSQLVRVKVICPKTWIVLMSFITWLQSKGNLSQNMDSVDVIHHMAAFCFQWRTLVWSKNCFSWGVVVSPIVYILEKNVPEANSSNRLLIQFIG